MAFEDKFLRVDRGTYNAHTGIQQYAKYRYGVSNDTIATIEAANYFPDNLNLDSEQVQINDLIEVQDSSNKIKVYRITALSPITLSQVLDYSLLETEPFSGSFVFDQGASVWTASQNITLEFEKHGKVVTMIMMGNLVNTTNGAPGSDINSLATAIPAQFRPRFNISSSVKSLENNVSPAAASGSVFITSAGQITFRKDQTAPAWTASTANTGVAAGSWTWLTA